MADNPVHPGPFNDIPGESSPELPPLPGMPIEMLLGDIRHDVRQLLSSQQQHSAMVMPPTWPKLRVRWGRTLSKGARDLIGAASGFAATYLLAQAGNQGFLDWANSIVEQYPVVGVAILALQPVAGIAAVRALQDRYQRSRL